jgi:hypothetical protein
VCVCVALVIHHGIRACAILSSVATRVYNIFFPTLSPKRHDFQKTVSEHKMCVLIFFKTFLWNIFHSKKNWARYDQKCILVFMYSTGYSCQILMEIEFYGQIFQNFSNQILWKSFLVGTELLHTDRRINGRTEGHDESNSIFSQFCS